MLRQLDNFPRGYYRGAGCCVIAFSTTDRNSFDAVESWHKKVTDECGDIVIVLCQNKVGVFSRTWSGGRSGRPGIADLAGWTFLHPQQIALGHSDSMQISFVSDNGASPNYKVRVVLCHVWEQDPPPTVPCLRG